MKKEDFEEEVRKHVDEELNKRGSESWHFLKLNYLREIVFGFNDGLVTVLASVVAVSIAVQEARIVIIAGLAAAFASAISMALGGYLSTKSQIEFYNREIEKEKREIETNPKFERAEIEELCRRKGFKEKEVKIIANRICSNKELWLKTMAEEELGLIQERFDNPKVVGLSIGIADLIAGFIPIIPFFALPLGLGLYMSVVFSFFFLFIVGAFKTKFTGKNWFKSGAETLLIGLIATLVSYFLGLVVSTI